MTRCSHAALTANSKGTGFMRPCFRFYMDDSGSPNPDHVLNRQNHSLDWFALGGILIDEARQEEAEAQISEFRLRWPQAGDVPLHSYEIRHQKGSFRWLADTEIRMRFFKELSGLMVGLPYHALAGVVHRPGYNERYLHRYGGNRWSMCRTAFTISVERAAKFARHHAMGLRVYVERSDKYRENLLRSYYQELKAEGLPFDKDTSGKYSPMSVDDLKNTLIELQFKPKASALMQIADLALWPVCQGGYDPEHRPYRMLQKHGKLLDAACPEGSGLLGVKYSCFDNVPPKNQKPPH